MICELSFIIRTTLRNESDHPYFQKELKLSGEYLWLGFPVTKPERERPDVWFRDKTWKGVRAARGAGQGRKGCGRGLCSNCSMTGPGGLLYLSLGPWPPRAGSGGDHRLAFSGPGTPQAEGAALQ